MARLSQYPAAQSFTGADFLIGNQAGSTVQFSAALLLGGQLNAQSGTAYTLQASDNGRPIALGNAATVTITVPAGLPVGFQCALVQAGIGRVVVAPGPGVAVNNRQGFTGTAGRYALITLLAIAQDAFILLGDGS